MTSLAVLLLDRLMLESFGKGLLGFLVTVVAFLPL
jgi:hypothetical protein